MKKKKIGFVFGTEVAFPTDVMNAINKRELSNVTAEVAKIGILNYDTKCEYDVLYDRFSYQIPFLKSALDLFEQKGTTIISLMRKEWLEEFLYLTQLNKIKINVPKTAVFPSKVPPNDISGESLRNLEYPLDWDAMFDYIGFPAEVKFNSSNEFYDCFRVFSKQDFFFIYDMSYTNTLVLQEYIEADEKYRVFVAGDEMRIMHYDPYKPAIDRYSDIDYGISESTTKEIKKIIDTIRKNYDRNIFIIDVAVADKIYLTNFSVLRDRVDSMHFSQATYNWLVEATATMLIEKVYNKTSITKVKKVEKPTTKEIKKNKKRN